MSAIYKNGTWYGKTSDSASLPSGGTTGQALVKASNTDGDVEWGNVAPSITVDSALSSSSENPVQNKVVNTALGNKADSSTVGTLSNLVTTAKNNIVAAINEIKNSLKTVATTGDFDDLTNKPDASGTIDMSVICANKPVNSEGVIYSTTERVIGRWIDGKPLYEKTIDCGALPNGTTKMVNHSISNISNIIKLDGYSTDGTNFINLPNTGIGGTNRVDIQIYATKTQIGILVDKSMNLNSYVTTYITLQYTKTTDA